jgi:hypothetical protein
VSVTAFQQIKNVLPQSFVVGHGFASFPIMD